MLACLSAVDSPDVTRLRDLDRTTLSPYLAQHVDNPVEWWLWGEDAFDEARRRDVPVFLSVGYAACHWCHVMAHESFDNPDLAATLNDRFVAIKVDREERPDLDALYMAATQLVAGHGGWPMSVFLLPDGRPLTAGTYYPPVDRSGTPGFGTLLRVVSDAWRTRRADVTAQADAIERALAREIAFVDHLAPRDDALDLDDARDRLRREIRDSTDERGGQGAPRFPRPSYVTALLDSEDPADVLARTTILDAMARGGLYDHLEGGFARYSVDDHWRVPHFEKMLSDQALLARTYYVAARTDPQGAWREVAERTVDFVLEHLSTGNGVAASLDADAGGHEGSHVTWTPGEVRVALAGLEESVTARVLRRWCITERGDLDGRSVPRLAAGEPWTVPTDLSPALELLRDSRRRRVQPTRDDKVILEWNAMFACALFAARDERRRDQALTLVRSLVASHVEHDEYWRTDARRDRATASDLAWWGEALVDAYEATGEDRWLDEARRAADHLIAHHWDGELPTSVQPDRGQGVFTTSDRCQDLFARPKDVFDGATPSSHAIVTRFFARLGAILDDDVLRSVARRLVDLAGELVFAHPRAVVDLVEAAAFVDGVEVVVPGGPHPLSDHVRSIPVFRGVLITGSGRSPLLADRDPGRAYVCHRGVCRRPVDDVSTLTRTLAEVL